MKLIVTFGKFENALEKWFLECTRSMLEGDVEWMYAAQGRDKWHAVVNTVMKFRGSIKCG